MNQIDVFLLISCIEKHRFDLQKAIYSEVTFYYIEYLFTEYIFFLTNERQKKMLNVWIKNKVFARPEKGTSL